MYEIKKEDIKSPYFNYVNFADLLYRLLVSEASRNEISISNVSGCSESKPDGGIDCLVANVKRDCEIIKAPISIYQVKAKEHTKADYKDSLYPFPNRSTKEVEKKLKKNKEFGTKNDLYELLSKGAKYIWFYKQEIPPNKELKIKKETADIIKDWYAMKCFNSDQVEVYSVKKIIALCNKYDEVKQFVNITIHGTPFNKLYEQFSTFNQWSDNFKKQMYSSEMYYKGSVTVKWINLINDALVSQDSQIIGVIGPSATGKTRFIHYVLSDMIDQASIEKKSVLNQRVVYVSLKYDTKDQMLKQFISFLSDLREHIFIVDDCNAHQVDWIKSKFNDPSVLGSKNKVILISSQLFVEEVPSIETIDFSPDICKLIVQEYLKHQPLDPASRARIAEYSSGFIFYAILMCQIAQKVDSNGSFIDAGKSYAEEIVQNIYDSKDNNSTKILEVCSLFSEFLFDTDSGESEHIDFITQTVFGKKESHIQDRIVVRKICIKGVNHGIFEKAGRYISIRPKPLAMYLASSFFEGYSENDIRTFLNRIETAGLINHFCNQIKHFKDISNAEKIIEELGKRGYAPLSNRNILFTQRGARMFRAMCEVHPVLCIDILKKSFRNKPDDFILEFTEGRREIIYALQKLVFRRDYFKDAVKILFRLAFNENESWANNATGILAQLFHIGLPGTEVDLETRKEVINSLYKEHKDKESLRIVLIILKHSIKTKSFGRMSGSEFLSAEIPRTDYHPITREEIDDYLYSSLIILREIMNRNNGLREEACSVVIDSIQDLILASNWHIFYDLFKDYEWSEKERLKIQEIINRANDFNYFRSDEERVSANIYSEKLWGSDVTRELVNIVVVPSYKEKLENIQNRIKELISIIIRDNIDILPFLHFMFYEQAREAFYFGQQLAKENYRTKEIIKKSLRILKDNPNANMSFLTGFVKNTDEKTKEAAYDRMIRAKSFHKQAVFLIAKTKAPIKYIMRLFPIVEKNPDLLIEIIHFSFGKALGHLPVKDKNTFFRRLMEYDVLGKQIAVECIFMEIFPEKRIKWGHEKIAEELLLKKEIVKPTRLGSSFLGNWSQLWIMLLRDKPKLAAKATKILLSVYQQQRDSFNIVLQCRELFEELYNEHFDDFWCEFGKLLLKRDLISWFAIKHDFGWQAGADSGTPLIGSSNMEKIMEWVEKTGKEGASAIIEIIQLYIKEEKEIKWTEYALSLIRNYWSDNEFRESLFSSLGTYSWYGSETHYVDLQIKLMEQLKDIEEITDHEWIEDRIAYLQERKKRIRIRDEEMFLGLDPEEMV